MATPLRRNRAASRRRSRPPAQEDVADSGAEGAGGAEASCGWSRGPGAGDPTPANHPNQLLFPGGGVRAAAALAARCRRARAAAPSISSAGCV
eukprot:CAMPEP_0172208458 /NCGR_PEP_ID=MMETSP1050-20130122/34478_1 /TAXON_ID=233186 /ORGANISM="Cryptomonas curvata, Strain CCAP979/52" /LENGTH=92 /DNA_ID=CAMNT_0012888041 /DNA_START=106 /DNA_END=384 /DNA_ORIENTATION=-